MLFRVVNWLTFVCLLNSGLAIPSGHTIPGTKHGLIPLTNHLNTTNLTILYCNHPDLGHQPTIIDCTRAVNFIRFTQGADLLRVWTSVDAFRFRATSKSCQVLVVPSIRDSADTFATIEVAGIAVQIMAACFLAGTGTTLGGRDLVGPRGEFQVVVAYVEPNQNDE